MTYSLPYSRKTWLQVRKELREQFRLWNVGDWVIPGRSPTSIAEAGAVTLTFVHPSGSEITIESSTQTTKRDNLRVLVLGIEALRLNERRGLGGLMRAAYLQLGAGEGNGSAPAASAAVTVRDPWAVLGIAPGTDIDAAEAVYRVRARKAHPDTGGDAGAMAELNAAIDAIRSGQA